MIAAVASGKVVVCQTDSKDERSAFSDLQNVSARSATQLQDMADIVIVVRDWHCALSIDSFEATPEERC